MNGGWGISYKIALRWMPLYLTDDKSTLVQIMVWCRQATSHYLSQWWLSPLSPYGVTRPQWVNHSLQCYFTGDMVIIRWPQYCPNTSDATPKNNQTKKWLRRLIYDIDISIPEFRFYSSIVWTYETISQMSKSCCFFPMFPFVAKCGPNLGWPGYFFS